MGFSWRSFGCWILRLFSQIMNHYSWQTAHMESISCFLFGFPAKKNRALVIYFPFEGLPYIPGLKWCIAQLFIQWTFIANPETWYDFWFQRPCFVAQVFDVWFAQGTIRPQARIPSGLEKEFKGPVLVDLTQDHVNGEELKGTTCPNMNGKTSSPPL